MSSTTAIINQYNPIIESMEGAALHYVCTLMKIPFLQLRAISNMVGERDKTKWEIQKAIDALNHSLVKILPTLIATHANIFLS